MIRDPEYLKAVRSMRCIATGRFASEHESIDPAHIGTAGKGVKSSDDEVLPLLHSLHLECHSRGEITVLREKLPNSVIRSALRALAREIYREWREERGK